MATTTRKAAPKSTPSSPNTPRDRERRNEHRGRRRHPTTLVVSDLECQRFRRERGKELVCVEGFAGRHGTWSLEQAAEDTLGRLADKRRRHGVDVPPADDRAPDVRPTSDTRFEQERLRGASALVDPRGRRRRVAKIAKRHLIHVAVQLAYPKVTGQEHDLGEGQLHDLFTSERLGKLE